MSGSVVMTSEILKYKLIKHPAKRKSLQAIAFDGIMRQGIISGRGVGALRHRSCREASTE
jgi:hypothetical protein